MAEKEGGLIEGVLGAGEGEEREPHLKVDPCGDAGTWLGSDCKGTCLI